MNTEINQTIKILKNGGVAVFPTDTAFGIGCRMDNEDAVRRVFEIKQRDFKNPLLVLVDSIEMARRYVVISKIVEKKLIKKYWPGGLTIFLKTKKGTVSPLVTSGTDVLAVRWPKNKVIEKIIHEVGVPIVATSANLSGDKTPFRLSDLNKTLLMKVDYVLDGECIFRKESTIIDPTVKTWKVIRQGAVKISYE